MHNDARSVEQGLSPRDGERTEMRITTNRGGALTFSSLQEVRNFSTTTAEDLAVLTAIIEDSSLDSSFVSQGLGLVNDLAFQLQQSVALMCRKEVHHA